MVSSSHETFLQTTMRHFDFYTQNTSFYQAIFVNLHSIIE